MRYNLLTLQLLYEGYSAENYPDFVKICTSRFTGNNPLRNLAGGFEYRSEYLSKIVFKTPCGRYVLGTHVFGNFSYITEWQPENNNPVIRCPFTIGDFSCDKVHPLLRNECKHNETGNRLQFCSCCMTDEPYEYDYSIEKANSDRDRYIEKRFQEFSKKKHGRVCRNHCRYNEVIDEWKMSYSPKSCAKNCYSSFCPVRGRELNNKKANVYYDLYTKTVHEDGFLTWENERLQKGIRYFDTPVSKDICEDFVKMQADEIEKDYRMNHGMKIVFNKSFQYEIRNIRIESRPRRNLFEDLKDIENGCYVSFAPEDEKKKKEEKRLKREQALRKRISSLEKKIVTGGFDSLSAGERYRAEKHLSCERIDELEIQYQKQKKASVPVQLSLLEL